MLELCRVQTAFCFYLKKKKNVSHQPQAASLLGAGWCALRFTLSLPSALVSETTARMPKETVPGPGSWDKTLSLLWEEDQDVLPSHDGSLSHQGHC